MDKEAWMYPAISHQLCEVTVHLIVTELRQGNLGHLPGG